MKLESKSFHELLQTSLFSNAYQKVINKKVNLSNNFAARTALEDQYGFTIVEDQPVKIITDVDGVVYYTISIERDVKEELKFENLVIKVDSVNVGAVILKYELNEKAVYDSNHDSYSVDVKEAIVTELNVSDSTLTSRFYYIKTWIAHCTVGINHSQYCGGNPRDVNFTSACGHYENIPASSNEDNPTTGGTSSTGGSGSGVGTSTVTPPNPDGTTPIGESTPPIKTVILPSEEVVETLNSNCDKLFKLFKNNRLMRMGIKNLVDNVGLLTEKGFSCNQDPTEISIRASVNSTASETSYTIYANTIGGMHNHPIKYLEDDSRYPMFSPADLGILVRLDNIHPTTSGGATPFTFNIMVTVEHTYAIVPNNTATLSTILPKFQNHETLEMFNKELAKKYLKLGKPWEVTQDELAKLF